jgi:microcystin-dependent protein
MDSFIGQIIMMASNFIPRGFMPCDGRFLPIQQNAALFSLLGTTYGGDGVTNFALPNLVSKVPIHQTATQPVQRVMVSGHGEDTSIATTQILYCICVQGIYPSRD